MKIPKYIDEALRQRTRSAKQFSKYDWIVSNWITQHGLEGAMDMADIYGGVESLENPEESEMEIRKVINNA